MGTRQEIEAVAGAQGLHHALANHPDEVLQAAARAQRLSRAVTQSVSSSAAQHELAPHAEPIDDELHWLSAAEIEGRYATRTLTPVDLVESLFARIDAIDPQIHAFVSQDRESVRQQARDAADQIAQGIVKGPLHGIPVAIKDVIDVAGQPTTCHSRILADNVAQDDAPVISRLRDAGAIIFGKVATHEFALGGPSFDLPFPPARNPWNLNHHPGGSSSGSAAGLAAGLFPLAIGTDTGGSIRHPAGACGVLGLKPTLGSVSVDRVFPVAPSLDCVGPMARTVEDVAALLNGLRSGSLGSRAPWNHLEALCAPGRPMRVGYVRRFHEIDSPADPDVASQLDAAVESLARAGACIHSVELPPLGDFVDALWTILSYEAWLIHASWLRDRPEDYASATREKLLSGAFISPDQYLLAQRRRGELTSAVDCAVNSVDVLVCANSMAPACAIDNPDELRRTYSRQARMPFSLSGHPAMSVPSGVSAHGMPLSIQVVGRLHDEATVLRVAKALEPRSCPTRPILRP